MKIATDVNLVAAWREGHMLMDYRVRKLFPNGKGSGLDKQCYVNFYRSDGGALERGIYVKIVDVYFCWEDLYEVYLRNKESISRICGYDESFICELENPSEWTMVNLASDIDACIGLNNI